MGFYGIKMGCVIGLIWNRFGIFHLIAQKNIFTFDRTLLSEPVPGCPRDAISSPFIKELNSVFFFILWEKNGHNLVIKGNAKKMSKILKSWFIIIKYFTLKLNFMKILHNLPDIL